MFGDLQEGVLMAKIQVSPLDVNYLYQPPLRGSIVYTNTISGSYAKFLSYGPKIDDIYQRGYFNIGKVIDKNSGIYKNSKFGLISFSLEKGIGSVPPDFVAPSIENRSEHITLNFGDIWMYNHFLKKIGLDSIIDSIIPEENNFFKALLGYRLLEPMAYNYAEAWYRKSFALILYPDVNLSSQRISDFLVKIGHEDIYNSFFTNYFSLISKSNNVNKKMSFPILIDSTGLQNDIKINLTAVNNHNGIVNNEIRLIYVIDKNTKLPIYFRYISGNIIDNNTLINTLNILSSYNINTELIIMDAGYYSGNNISELISTNIPFITRMVKNRKEYKELMAKYGDNLKTARNSIKYESRVLFGIKVPIILYEKQLFAYILLDIDTASKEEKDIIQKYDINEDNYNDIQKKLNSAGKFILLSSDEYDINEILPLYYTRQHIEQMFDICKTYIDILPLRVHNEKTLRGTLLIFFIASIIYSYISNELKKSNYSAIGSFYLMKLLQIEIYNSSKIVQELTKDHNEIIKLLNIDCPFKIETGNPLKKLSYVAKLQSKNTKRGRPKGSKNKQKSNLSINNAQSNIINKKRGRPKGSKNKFK
jgi:transposase